MKKTFKSFIATILAAVISLSCFTASFATGETLDWDFYGDTYSYEYAGTLIEGENEIGDLDTSPVYFDFEAQNAGFYTFSFSYDDAEFWFDVPESVENGVAYGFIERFIFDQNDMNTFLFYLEEGEQIIGMDNYYSENDSTITVEYLGEEITAVETALETILLDCDIYCYNYEDSDEYFYSLYTDVNVIFSSGKTITLHDFDGTIATEIEKGENTVPVSILGKEYDLTVNVALVTDYIDNIEISNIEYYLNLKEYYDSYEGIDPYGETLTVNFKDGTSVEVTIGYDEPILMPNGSKAWYGYDFSLEDGEAFFNIYIGDALIKTYECNKTQADFKENIDELNSNRTYLLNELSYCVRQAIISVLECNNIYEYLEYGAEDSLFYLIWAYESFTGLFKEVFNLIRYYIA